MIPRDPAADILDWSDVQKYMYSCSTNQSLQE